MVTLIVKICQSLVKLFKILMKLQTQKIRKQFLKRPEIGALPLEIKFANKSTEN